MDGDIGFYNIKPDQMQVINPLLILALIPLYDAVFYPLLSKVGIRRPLQKLTAGGLLAGVAFLLSALVEFELEKTYSVLPGAGEAQLRIFNGLPCDYNATTGTVAAQNFTIKSLQAFEQKHIAVSGDLDIEYTLKPVEISELCSNDINLSFKLNETIALSFFLNNQNEVDMYIDEPDKSSSGDPKVRILLATDTIRNITLKSSEQSFSFNSSDQSLKLVRSGSFDVTVDDKHAAYLELKLGGVYTVILREKSDNEFEFQKIEIASPNTVNMLWLIPQYFVMTLGEVMFSVTGLAFSYAQAPESMKSVLQACWLLAVAFGNVIDMIVVGAKLFNSQAFEFLLFAILMVVDMVIFMKLAHSYKSHDNPDHPGDESLENKKEEN